MRAMFLLPLLFAGSAAADSQRVAVLEFDASKAGADLDRTYFSDLVRGAVHKAVPRIFVMTRESTVLLLKAQGKKLESCEGECEVETGKMLGADYVISGRMTKVGTRYSLTLRLHATASGELLNTSEARGKSLDEIVDGTDAAASALARPLSLADPLPVQATATRAASPAEDNGGEARRKAEQAELARQQMEAQVRAQQEHDRATQEHEDVTRCALGTPIDCYNLGVSYETGQGHQRNGVVAKQLFQMACNKNYAPACAKAN